ncbi:LacI family transcriptional regulator [Synergistales bacterium]|nr:LacI family transcriptional regulator [Synergistales bacterium]
MGAMKVNIKEVALKAGVSTATVSRVINKTRFVSTKTESKVLEVMRVLDYSPNLIAQSLRSQRSKIIGVLIPDFDNFFFTNVVRGIEETLRKNGYNIILGSSEEDPELERERVKAFNSQQVDGLIITSTSKEQGYLKDMLSGKYPLVFVDRMQNNYDADCVLLDDTKSTYEATSLLLSKGYRRIGLITGLPWSSTTRERILGYERAFKRYNYEVEPSLIKSGNFKYESGYELARKLVTEYRVEALFVSNSLMTIGAMVCLKELKLKIPSQIAIVGSDDYTWAMITDPPMTVVKQPAYELGAKAATVLIDRIENPDKPFDVYRLSESTLVLRDSC